jgi:site-specific DNA recombinase
LRKRAAEADAKLKRLYDAIENGVAYLAAPLLKDRICRLKATRDQAPRRRCEGRGCVGSARVGPYPSGLVA